MERDMTFNTFCSGLGLTALLLASAATGAYADDAKPFAGQSITVLLPSPQDANMAADFEKATGIKLDLQTASWDDVSTKVFFSLLGHHFYGTPHNFFSVPSLSNKIYQILHTENSYHNSSVNSYMLLLLNLE